MITLAIDTSTAAGSVAILRDTELVGVIGTASSETYSSRLFRQLQILLNEVDIRLEEVDLYAVTSGPGSFTGLRVGLTAVKGWAEVFQKPVAAVSVLEAVAAMAGADSVYRAPVVDARRGQIYGGLYRFDAGRLCRVTEDCVATLEEYLNGLRAQRLDAPLTFVTPTPEILAGALDGFDHCRTETVSSVLAPVVGRLGRERAKRGETVDALHLDAHYVRRSDAELLWKGPR
jgi:tRNA threonylcarbamoyladenosine biosynthesis protein TsaB